MTAVHPTETRRCSRMNVKVRRLLKGLRYISLAFGEGDEKGKDEMKIGYPTDVKHVAHIGCNGPSASAPAWMKEFKEANGVQGPNSAKKSVGSSSRDVKKTKSKSKQPLNGQAKDGAVSEEDPAKPQRSTIRRRRRKKKKNPTTKVKAVGMTDDDASLRSCATSPYPTKSASLADKSSVYESALGSASDDEASDDSSYGTVTGERFLVEDDD